RSLVGHRGVVMSIAYSPDSKLLASAGADGTIRFWDTGGGQLLRTLSGHRGGVQKVAFSADGRRLISGGADHTVRLWDVNSGEGRILGSVANDVRRVAFAP